ncbi:MAG: hypothetical protein AAGA54_32065 [Myxococcota bacterium]
MSDEKPGVLDPQWEDALRAGQAAEGERGSVESELAVLHLLRHARGPQPLEPDALDAVWSELEPEIAGQGGFTTWWQRLFDWRVGVGVAVASAAAAVIFFAASPAQGPLPPPDADAVAQAPALDPTLSATLQTQFDLLEPAARAQIDGDVAAGRGALRTELLASIAAPGTVGGAP